MPDTGLGQELARAERLLQSFKNDSAKIITTALLRRLKTEGKLDDHFGLQVQVVEAMAYEQDQDGELAIRKLHEVRDRCKQLQFWDLCARSNLAVALIYEKIGLDKQCLAQLRETDAYIDQHSLDSIYPYFAIRMSSWQRIYGNKDSAIYFAREALRTAPTFNLHLETAIGHMLMNMLLPQSAVDARLKHAIASVRLYQKLEDYTGCSYMYGAISSLYFQTKNFRQALVFNDSALTMANLAVAKGHEKHSTIASLYQFRGQVFKVLGQSDSAWFYLDKGYRMALEFQKKDMRDRVLEIEARYANAQKQEQLDEQAQQLIAERQRRNWLVGGLFLVLLLTAALAYFYVQLRTANEKNRHQAELLVNLDMAKSRFFANISHELRTPLTLLLGPVNTLLNETNLSEKQRNLLKIARRSGDHLGQLINEILDLRKLEMGKMSLKLKPTALHHFFQNYTAQFESLAERKQILFSFESSVPPAFVGNIDREKCRQILNNLLSNAFKFTPEGGRINVELSVNNGVLDLRVADTGRGIHPEDLPYVFDRFFQTNRPDKPAEGGTGIGLNLCQEYARLLGGNIYAESNAGTGTRFRVTFPVELLDQTAQPIPDPESAIVFHEPVAFAKSAQTTEKPVILIVEDNPDLQDYISLILSKHYNVVTAEHGQAALDYLLPPAKSRQQMANCQLVLSDLMMPVMDGYQLLEKLKSDDATRHLPVIMLTARAEARDRLKALRIGVDDYLTKPFDEEELLVRIDNLLKNQASRQLEVPAESNPEAEDLPEPDQNWLETFEAYVRKNIANNILSVPLLAQEFTMSESTLLRQLKRLTGLTPGQYLQEMRLDEARRLLESQAMASVTQVASKVGYSDARAFSRSFRARFGKLPSELAED
ncbi:MAG: response regulator [Lewinellaceae bacterium]|nr:response regulator [Saprospiraceae bacterium]MCB9331551.1 response regulator [Lewinellaceae bacterium]